MVCRLANAIDYRQMQEFHFWAILTKPFMYTMAGITLKDVIEESDIGLMINREWKLYTQTAAVASMISKYKI